MKTSRLEAFSDGVIAILITIMVLEMKTPEGDSFTDLSSLTHVFFSYLLSFIFLGIYWNNHHHLLNKTTLVNSKILWANLNLLFWLSLLPFVTGWVGEHKFASHPLALYGVILLCASISYKILVLAILQSDKNNEPIYSAYNNRHSKLAATMVLNSIGIVFSFFAPILSLVIYASVALLWVIPDKRLET